MGGIDCRARAGLDRWRRRGCADNEAPPAGDRDRHVFIDARRGLDARTLDTFGRVTRMARARHGHMYGAIDRGRGAGGGCRKGAGLPEFDHVFEAGEDADEGRAYQCDIGINNPIPLDRPGRHRSAERRELRAQGGRGVFHGEIDN